MIVTHGVLNIGETFGVSGALNIGRLAEITPAEHPNDALVDVNGNYILDYQGNYIITTEV